MKLFEKIFSPEWLQYGITGLVALTFLAVVGLLYFKRPQFIVHTMVFGFLLVMTAGIFSQIGSQQKLTSEIDDLKRENERLVKAAVETEKTIRERMLNEEIGRRKDAYIARAKACMASAEVVLRERGVLAGGLLIRVNTMIGTGHTSPEFQVSAELLKTRLPVIEAVQVAESESLKRCQVE